MILDYEIRYLQLLTMCKALLFLIGVNLPVFSQFSQLLSVFDEFFCAKVCHYESEAFKASKDCQRIRAQGFG
jgi:hypothetical protein